MKTFLCKTCVLIVFGVFSISGYGQSDSLKIDSLKNVLLTQKEDTNKVNTLNELGKTFFYKSDNKSVAQYTNEALTLAEKLNYNKGLSIAYRTKARNSSNSEEMLHFFNLSISFAKESKDSSEIYWSYFTKGDLCRSSENFTEALSSYLEALKIAELTRDKNNMALAYDGIAAVYLLLGNDAEVLKNYTAALKLFTQLKSFEDIASCYLGIGNNYYNKGDYNTALYNLNQGLINIEQAGSKVHPGFDIKGWILLNIGRCHEMLVAPGITGKSFTKEEVARRYIEAENNYKAAEVFARKDWNLFLWSDVFLNLGNLCLKTNRVMASKPYLDSALQLFQILNSKDGLQKIYLKYSLYDSATGNYKKAYEDHKLYMQYFKEIQSDSSIQKTTQLQAQYNFDKKETLAKVAQDKKDADAKRIKNQQYFAIGALGIVVLAVVIIALIQYRNNKHKQQANLALQHQKEKVESTLTELKATQTQLIQSEKMASLGELTAGIAHEIQNPLNFVNNFSEVNTELIDEAGQEIDKGNIDEVKIILNDIKENEQKINHHGKRADAIVKGMLQHSQKSKGVKEPTDINALCDEYLRLSYHGLKAKDKDFNATLKTDFDSSLEKINIIPQDIGRVLLNLYNNAFYAVNEKKKTADETYQPVVTVTTKRSSLSPLENLSREFGRGRSEVEIRIGDNGNGIPQKIIDKIFQPFFTTKPTGEGTGLGLSLSYDIVKAHGGEIKVESKEGGGSEFIITFPPK
ncbi:MAG: ATP-binding protein [Parafilimonas sp.]